ALCYAVVTQSWADAETERLFRREKSRYIPPDIQATAVRKLKMLNAAIKVDDLLIPPSNRLEKLKGDRAGQWSISINMQWRICFNWEAGQGLRCGDCRLSLTENAYEAHQTAAGPSGRGAPRGVPKAAFYIAVSPCQEH